jgi:hypothetical protein
MGSGSDQLPRETEPEITALISHVLRKEKNHKNSSQSSKWSRIKITKTLAKQLHNGGTLGIKNQYETSRDELKKKKAPGPAPLCESHLRAKVEMAEPILITSMATDCFRVPKEDVVNHVTGYLG